MTKQLLGPNNMEGKQSVIKKSQVTQFLMHMKAAVWQLCNRRKELGIFLKFSEILVTTFSVVPLHERALSKITTYTLFPCCNVNNKNVLWPLGPSRCLNLVIKVEVSSLNILFLSSWSMGKDDLLKVIFWPMIDSA